MKSLREEYFSLISESQILNVLDNIDIGYSKKLCIMKKLLEKYSANEINFALNIYQNHYIAIGKFNLPFIYNTLSSIIDRSKERRSK